MPGWRARRIASATIGLSVEQAAAVDSALAPRADQCGTRTIDQVIAEVTATTDPAEQKQAEDLDRSDWSVKLFNDPVAGPGHWAGTSMLQIIGDTVDLTHLLDLVNAEAATIDTDDPFGVRQAMAVGTLIRRMNGGRRPRFKLYVHAEFADLLDDTVGVGSVERLGPLTMDRIRDWAGRCAVTVLPVLREDRADAVDQHDPPAWMRELVILRDGHFVHPYCQTDARACDLDHIVEYLDLDRGGPPGQTHPGNLASA